MRTGCCAALPDRERSCSAASSFNNGAPASPASPDVDPRPCSRWWWCADDATGRSLWLATSATDGSGGGDQMAVGFSGEGPPGVLLPLDSSRSGGGGCCSAGTWAGMWAGASSGLGSADAPCETTQSLCHTRDPLIPLSRRYCRCE